MKYIILVFVVAFGLFSCSKKETQRENLQNAVNEFSKQQGVLETVSYFPEQYTETQTDSIISNSFKVRIKNYTKMDADIHLNTTRESNKKVDYYHRVFASDVKVTHKSKVILNTTLSADNFKNTSPFWNSATLEHVWVNQELSNADALNLNVSFINPKSNAYKLFELVVTSDGTQRIHLIEEHS